MNTLRMTPEQAAAHQERAQGWRKPKPPSLAEINAEVARLDFKPAKPSKYRNVKTTIDGLTFDSKREARRYVELKNMQQAGLIYELRTQVEVPCVVNGVPVCVYVADFQYRKVGAGLCFPTVIYEDAKGCRTDVYRLKKKLVAACTGIEITEV